MRDHVRIYYLSEFYSEVYRDFQWDLDRDRRLRPKNDTWEPSYECLPFHRVSGDVFVVWDLHWSDEPYSVLRALGLPPFLESCHKVGFHGGRRPSSELSLTYIDTPQTWTGEGRTGRDGGVGGVPVRDFMFLTGQSRPGRVNGKLRERILIIL